MRRHNGGRIVPKWIRWIGSGVTVAVFVFAAVAVVLHGLRPDLDWMHHTLSAYLRGPFGAWLKAAYLLLSVALAALGLAYDRAVVTRASGRWARWLFAVSGMALTVTALTEVPYRGHGSRLEGLVHVVAAGVTFLSVTTAMLVQSWRLRLDPAWRAHFIPALSMAVLCFVGLWTFALWRGLPAGLSQKMVIAAILVWLMRAGWWLRNVAPSPEGRTRWSVE